MKKKNNPIVVSRDTAIRAALDAIDEYGLEQFNMNMVAERLSIRAPSLYYHFKDKLELLTEVARILLLDADQEKTEPSADWKEGLVATSLAVRRSIMRHPNAAPLLLSHPPRHLALSGYERTMKYLEKAGVPADQHMRIVAGLDAISWGSILFEAVAVSLGFQLYPVYDPGLFPALARAKKLSPLSDEELFAGTMRTFLAGLDTQIDTHVAPAAPKAKKPGPKPRKKT
ncbi:MAG TPA: TetR family transcriptional regulator [Rhizomicrobium sp.]|nr:TetR family transcriptional regulator [Rhizomicrobium sp.]